MRCEDNSELYLSLSRKELQDLCKINHLPANRSKDELAKSLSLFFEKKSATSTAGNEKLSTEKGADPSENSKGACERTVLLESGNRSPLCMKVKERDMDLQSSKSAPNTSKDAVCPHGLLQKLCDSTFKAGGEGREPYVAASVHQKQPSSGCHISGTDNEIEKYSELGNNTNGVSNNAASNIDLYNSVLPNKLPNMTTKGEGNCRKDAPSFQFFVMSEEGLNLYVDLNSSPAEWVNSLKEEVRDSLKMSDPKYTILNSTGIEKNCDCNTSTLSSDSESRQPDATVGSSDSSVLTSSVIPVKLAGCLDGIQVTSSSATLFTTQKHREYVCPGNDNAFAENSVDASSGVEKNNASVRDTSLRPISDMSENDGLVNSPTIITEKSNVLQSNETEKITGASQYSIERGPIGNTENDNDACQLSIEKEPAVGSFEIVGCDDRTSNFNGHEPKILDCLANEAQSDGVSAASILINHPHGFENSFMEDPVSVLMVEVAGNSTEKDKEIPEPSQSQNSSENNSKRPHSTEFREEFSSKRQNSSSQNKSGMMVNLRSTRTSAKETVFEQAACPRRSSRLREVRPR